MGDPDTLYRFWRQITAAQYRSNINLALPSIAAQLGFGLRLSFWQFGPPGLPLILWGLIWGWQHQRKTTLFVLVGSLSVMAYAILYAIADDQDTYYMLAHVLLVAPLVWGGARLLNWTTTKISGSQPRRALQAGLLLSIPLLALISNFSAGNRAAYWYHDDYFHQLTTEVPAGGAIFTRDWQFYSPSLYFQYVLDDRRDLRIIDVELMRRGWYLDYLDRQYPELTAPAAAQLETYRQLRDDWERAPRQFESNTARVQALQNAYIDAINALIDAAAAQNQVGISHDMESGIAAGYTWIPVGLTFRLDREAAATTQLPPLTWDLSRLQGQWRHLPDEPARKVASVYVLMLQNRAIYLARQGDAHGALAALDLADQIRPDDATTLQLRVQIGALLTS